MGIRETQFIGLPSRAIKFLDKQGNTVPITSCPHCKKAITFGLERKVSSYAKGMFDEEELPLYTYNLKNGSCVIEEVQNIPWSSGPVIFTQLIEKIHGKKKILSRWTEKQMEEYL